MTTREERRAEMERAQQARDLERARRIARLPQWAQRELENLERTVAYLRGKLAEGPENSDTFVDHLGAERRTPLGQRPRISFHLEEPGEAGWNAHGSVEAHTLEVRGRRVLALTGQPGLQVLPRSSNQVWVVTGDQP